MAASTCSHRLCWRQTSPIAGIGIHRVGRRRAHSGAHKARSQPGAPVGVDLSCQGLGAHGEILVDVDQAQILDADAGDHRRFLQRGMGLRGGVGDKPAVASFLVADVVGGALPRRPAGRRARRSKPYPESRRRRYSTTGISPGRPSMPTSQSITCVSSSVQAGLVDHSIPCTPRPEERRSPRIPGPDALQGK